MFGCQTTQIFKLNDFDMIFALDPNFVNQFRLTDIQFRITMGEYQTCKHFTIDQNVMRTRIVLILVYRKFQIGPECIRLNLKYSILSSSLY